MNGRADATATEAGFPDTTPLTDAQVWERPPFVHEGIPWTTLGEDGEYAVMRGHDHAEQLQAAMFDLYGDQMVDEESIEKQAWAVFTKHRDDCREDLLPEDECGCGEFGWFAFHCEADTPGALPVTWWSW